MNPFAFEFNSAYLAFLAYELYTNRFFEFVQAGFYDEDDNPAGLPSVFNKEFQDPFKNKAFDNSWGAELTFDAKELQYWEEYFGRYRITQNRSTQDAKID